jgi:hypothetical protein
VVQSGFGGARWTSAECGWADFARAAAPGIRRYYWAGTVGGGRVPNGTKALSPDSPDLGGHSGMTFVTLPASASRHLTGRPLAPQGL